MYQSASKDNSRRVCPIPQVNYSEPVFFLPLLVELPVALPVILLEAHDGRVPGPSAGCPNVAKNL